MRIVVFIRFNKTAVGNLIFLNELSCVRLQIVIWLKYIEKFISWLNHSFWDKSSFDECPLHLFRNYKLKFKDAHYTLEVLTGRWVNFPTLNVRLLLVFAPSTLLTLNITPNNLFIFFLASLATSPSINAVLLWPRRFK